MKIIITIEDIENGEVSVAEERIPANGETEMAITTASALADAMFEVMDTLGEEAE